MAQDIRSLADGIFAAIEQAENEEKLESVRQKHFGKKSKLSQLLQGLGDLEARQRARMGAELNKLNKEANESFARRKSVLANLRMEESLREDTTDLSLPARGRNYGGWHPISRTRRCIEDIFHQAGYDTVLGPEMESDYYNFEALNFPPNHPARDMHDTFYFGDGKLLRTHTSPSQIRAMERSKPPIRVICPGRTFRCDHDATHTPMFHQVEGMVVDKGISFADLKGTLQGFMDSFFGRKTRLRFRASYFPFTEPSAEVDILWDKGSGKAHKEEWLEILGCGMVHPNVLRVGGIDTAEHTGFAFGMGVERMAMCYYGIDDIRLFYENDFRFLRQFV